MNGWLSPVRIAILMAVVIVGGIVIILMTPGQTATDLILDARGSCEVEAERSCRLDGTLPTTWNTPTKSADQTTYACDDLLSCTCDPVTRTVRCVEMFP